MRMFYKIEIVSFVVCCRLMRWYHRRQWHPLQRCILKSFSKVSFPHVVYCGTWTSIRSYCTISYKSSEHSLKLYNYLRLLAHIFIHSQRDIAVCYYELRSATISGFGLFFPVTFGSTAYNYYFNYIYKVTMTTSVSNRLNIVQNPNLISQIRIVAHNIIIDA